MKAERVVPDAEFDPADLTEANNLAGIGGATPLYPLPRSARGSRRWAIMALVVIALVVVVALLTQRPGPGIE